MKFRIHPLLLFAALVALTSLAGCAGPLLFQPPDGKAFDDPVVLPGKMESTLEALLLPAMPNAATPATVLDPERKPRHLSLNEAVALALEKGTIGIQSVRVPGLASEDLGGFTGQGIFGSDSIRVLSFQPARLGTAIEAGLARFDPFLSTGIGWRATDEPTQGLSSFSNGHGANFFSSLIKPLASGGSVGMTFSTDYQFLSDPPGGSFSVLNPSYQTRMQFGFEQPLLRGFGTEINQLRSSFPGSNLYSAISGRASSYASEGILITRIRHDQARAELERNVNFLLLNVQAAYWNLYGAYVNLHVTNQSLKQAHMSWSIGQELEKEGRIDNGQLSQIRAQYEQFRGDRLRALSNVLDAERNLRILCGLAVEDGERLVPIDTPVTLASAPHWPTAVHDALNLRPELVMARQDIMTKQMNLTLRKNEMLPDLRLQATHTTIGLGSRLDGNGTFLDANGDAVTSNALRSLTSSHFNNWQVGLNLNIPLGFRHEAAQIRDARLALTQSYLALKNHELKATNFLAKQHNRVLETSKLIDIRRQQRLAQGTQVETRFRKFLEWDIKERYPHLEFLLDAQRQWASALNQEYQAIIDYNIALATWEFAKGTIMQSCRVRISEAPLPAGVAMRAVEFEREASDRQVSFELDRAARQDLKASPPTTSVLHEYAVPSLAVLNLATSEDVKVIRKAEARPEPAALLPMPIASPRQESGHPVSLPALGEPVVPVRFGAPNSLDKDR